MERALDTESESRTEAAVEQDRPTTRRFASPVSTEQTLAYLDPAEAVEPVLPPAARGPGTLQSVEWFRNPVRYLERNRRRHGDIFSVRLGPLKRAVVLSNPAAVKAVLTGDPDRLRMGATNGLFRPVLGSSSLFLLDGGEHRRQRRLMMPAFQRGHVRRFSDVTASLAEREVDSWPMHEPINLHERMRAITLDMILEVVFGTWGGSREQQIRGLLVRLLDLVQDPLAVLPWFQYELSGRSRFGRLMATVREIDEVLFAEIAERRRDSRIAERDDVLSLLARAAPGDEEFLTDREIRDELVTLLIAGHETTATALAWCFERLLRHERAMEALLDELDSAHDDVWLDAVVRETLRQRPVLPITARKLSGPIELGGYVFPRGWTLMPSIYLLHHEPSLYPEPHEFRPERFLEHSSGAQTWIPFGAGVRHCIGSSLAVQTTKVILRTVLRRAVLRADRDEPEPISRRNFTLAPGRGATAEVVERRRWPRVRQRHFAREPARPAIEPQL